VSVTAIGNAFPFYYLKWNIIRHRLIRRGMYGKIYAFSQQLVLQFQRERLLTFTVFYIGRLWPSDFTFTLSDSPLFSEVY